jgi:hypothetical protein
MHLKEYFNEEITELERKHLCTKCDLLNIEKSHGINKVKKHAIDHTNVYMYVSEFLND